jgi:hypothetical protein
MSFALRLHRARWSILGLGVLLLLGLALGLHGMTDASSRAAGTLPAPAAVDPRLVLHPHAVPFSGSIAGGVSVDGTLWPSLPGLNTLSLRILLPGRQVAHSGRVHLVLSMPGMAMRPMQATLTARSQGYRGSIALPMFGRYRAQVDAWTAGGRYAGAFSLTLPLTLASLPTGAGSARPQRTSSLMNKIPSSQARHTRSAARTHRPGSTGGSRVSVLLWKG